MTDEELEMEICKLLFQYTYKELAELKINGQHAVRIKNGQTVHFYKKTRDRLAKLVKKRVA